MSSFFFEEPRGFLERVLKKLFVKEKAIKAVSFRALVKEAIINIASSTAALP